MKLVIGLGNPGAQYAQTRHNAGFRVVDKLATQLGWHWSERRSRALLASGTFGSEKMVLVKPSTFMNNSGESVGELVRWYKVQLEDVLVIYDELDLPIGKVRLKGNGSAAGHKGLESIIHHLHTNHIPRLRIGIGRPSHETNPHVLGTPSVDDRILLEAGEDRAVEAIRLFMSQGIAITMNMINADPEAQQKAEEKRQERQRKTPSCNIGEISDII